MKTARQVAEELIAHWEGELSVDPKDSGNYVVANGRKILVGSKYGVTGNALAKHRNVTPISITPAIMAALTMDEAVDIACKEYYNGYRLNLLPWCRVTAIMLDFVWASGSNAIKVLQRTLHLNDDGIIGPKTIAAYTKELTDYSEEGFANSLIDYRLTYISTLKEYLTYRRGWTSRITSLRPATPWWKSF